MRQQQQQQPQPQPQQQQQQQQEQQPTLASCYPFYKVSSLCFFVYPGLLITSLPFRVPD